MSLSRRTFLQTNILTEVIAVDCLAHTSEFMVESHDSPFFEHFHFLTLPIKALINPPAEGIEIKTSPVDSGSVDQEAFAEFIKSSGLDEKALSTHSHAVKFSQAQLQRIASGEKDVEVRVISAAGNYVHNFLITASPMVLATIRQSKIKKGIL